IATRKRRTRSTSGKATWTRFSKTRTTVCMSSIRTSPSASARTSVNRRRAGSFRIKVAYIGAGSGAFARQVCTDILHVDGLDSGEFALCDIDAPRLDLAHQLVAKL